MGLRPAGSGLASVVSPPPYDPPVLYGEGGFDINGVKQRLQVSGLPGDAPLNVLVVEVYTESAPSDPVGDQLGEVPFVRTSPLTEVPPAC